MWMENNRQCSDSDSKLFSWLTSIQQFALFHWCRVVVWTQPILGVGKMFQRFERIAFATKLDAHRTRIVMFERILPISMLFSLRINTMQINVFFLLHYSSTSSSPPVWYCESSYARIHNEPLLFWQTELLQTPRWNATFFGCHPTLMNTTHCTQHTVLTRVNNWAFATIQIATRCLLDALLICLGNKTDCGQSIVAHVAGA